MQDMIVQLNRDLIEYAWFLNTEGRKPPAPDFIANKLVARLEKELVLPDHPEAKAEFKQLSLNVTHRLLGHVGYLMGKRLELAGYDPSLLLELSEVHSLAQCLYHLSGDTEANLALLDAECDRYFGNPHFCRT